MIVGAREDTGMGISDDVKPRLFQSLFTTRSRGHGLGLAVCRRVVEAYGGTIIFESEVGKGTRFTIRLP
jgi:signal transduction histidine kinase